MDQLDNPKNRRNDYKSKNLEKIRLINIPRLLLQLAGMWPSDQIKEGQRKLYLLYKYFISSYYMIFNLLLIVECIRLIMQRKEFERISTAFGILVTLANIMLKVIVYQRNSLPDKFSSFIKTEKDIIWKSSDDGIKDLYILMAKYYRYLNICVISFSIGTILFFYVIDIFGSDGLLNAGTKYYDFDTRSFMYEIYFPLDKNKYFYLLFVYNIVCTSLTIIFYVSCQSMLYGYILFAICRLLILQIRLEKLDIIAKEAQVDFIIILKICIKEHQELIRLVETLNDSTKYLQLVDFLLNSFKVAFNLFNVMTANSMSDLMFPLVYALLITWEVFSIGWLCNEIKVQSLAISDAAYRCLWYDQNEDTKRILNIMVMRAQKPLALTIGPFQPMTTETILVILKATYSYVTIMTK